MSEIPIIRDGWATSIDIDHLTAHNPRIQIKTPDCFIKGEFDRIYDDFRPHTAFPTNLSFYVGDATAEHSIAVTIDGVTYPVSDHVIVSVRGESERGIVDSLLRATVEAINTVDSEWGK